MALPMPRNFQLAKLWNVTWTYVWNGIFTVTFKIQSSKQILASYEKYLQPNTILIQENTLKKHCKVRILIEKLWSLGLDHSNSLCKACFGVSQSPIINMVVQTSQRMWTIEGLKWNLCEMRCKSPHYPKPLKKKNYSLVPVINQNDHAGGNVHSK